MVTQQIVLYALVGFALGAAVGWLISWSLGGRRALREGLARAERLSAAEERAETERRRREQLEQELGQAEAALRDLDRRLAVADERMAGAQRALDEQRAFVEHARQELEVSFKALAARALEGTTEQFLTLAEQRMATARTEATADLDQRKKAIETLLHPFRESLDKLDQRTNEIERARVEAYSRIDQQVELLSRAASALEQKTSTLATALKSSTVRGRWGEMALRNVVELAGMTAHCDFEEQMTLTDGRRPDMVIHLPGDRRIAVDAKAPLTAYMDASEAANDAAREEALSRHVRDLRNHIRGLSAREYAAALGTGVDLVVLFLPGDPFLGAAFARDPELQVEALRSKVLVATPTTLVALLRTVAIYWQQQAMAENAEAIAGAARELYERAAKFGEDLASVGRGLKGALDAYNRAVGSFDRRLLPMGRRLEEMKVAEQSRRQLEAPESIEEAPREPIRS